MARLLHLDNEYSKKLIVEFNEEELEYQISSPGNHIFNPVERTIQELEKHFISVLAVADPDFPKNNWEMLLPQMVLTLNLFRESPKSTPKYLTTHKSMVCLISID